MKKDERNFIFVFRGQEFVSKMFIVLSLIVFSGCLSYAQAQNKPNENSNAATVPTPTAKNEANILKTNSPKLRDDNPTGIAPILIGFNDTVDVQIYNKPQWSGPHRVSAAGTIRLNLIDEDVVAVCKSERELADEITTLYKKYVRQPYVNVLISGYTSQPVAVIGKVEKPGTFQLTRRMRLLEVLSMAGGPDKLEAGTKIQVARLGSENVCQKTADQNDIAGVFLEYDLKKLLTGDENSNPYMRPGDVVTVEKAEKIYVIGNVNKPQPIKLEGPMNVSQAIAAAGGMLPSTKKTAIILYRQVSPDSVERQEIIVDLDAEKKSKEAAKEATNAKNPTKKPKNKNEKPKKADEIAENSLAITGSYDPVLLPNDIIEVPIDGKSELRKNMMKAVIGGLPSIISAFIYGFPK